VSLRKQPMLGKTCTKKKQKKAWKILAKEENFNVLLDKQKRM
jgi:hypothetical protein